MEPEAPAPPGASHRWNRGARGGTLGDLVGGHTPRRDGSSALPSPSPWGEPAARPPCLGLPLQRCPAQAGSLGLPQNGWALSPPSPIPQGPGTTYPGLLQNGLSLRLLGRDHGAFRASIATPSKPELRG